MTSREKRTTHQERLQARRQYLAKLVLGHAVVIEHTRTVMCVRLDDLRFEEPLKDFPSEALVAQVALAVETYRPGNYKLPDISEDLAQYVVAGGMDYDGIQLRDLSDRGIT